MSVWKKNGNNPYILNVTPRHVLFLVGWVNYSKQERSGGADNECIDIVTFADRELSDGGLYERLRFRIDRILEPDYTYLVNNTRKHKFGYRF